MSASPSSICAACHKSKSNLLRCSRCGMVYYCDSQCQKKHWKKHKSKCQCYTVKAIDGKGFGMVASRKIKQGDVILTEEPVLTANMALSQDDRNSFLISQFSKLSLADKERVDSLYDNDPEEDAKMKVVRIFKCNSIQICESESMAGLYPNIARINHSCAPNVVWSWTKDNVRQKQVKALIEIEAGEEICTNYIDDFQNNYSSHKFRQKILLDCWHFHCACSICSLPPDKLGANNQIRSSIMENHNIIPEKVSTQDLEGCISSSKSKLQGILSLGNQLISDLPAAYLETYEFLAIGKALRLNVEDPEVYRQKAEDLAKKFGDKFWNGYNTKLQEILYGS